MARRKISGIAVRESDGDVLVYDNADVTVYRAGTSTEITVYDTESGSDTDITTESNGYFEFWIPFNTDDALIKIVISKTGYSDLIESSYPAFPRDSFLVNNSNIPGDSISDALENLTKKYKYFIPNFDDDYNNYPTKSISGSGGEGLLQGYFPDDLNSIISMNLRIITEGSNSSADFDFYTSWAGAGESPLANSDSDLSSTYDVTDNNFGNIDVSGLFSAPDPGDSFKILVGNNETFTLHLLGLILNYTSYPGN